tara:strand:+ start:939 stop:1103 length:165 start_codon:yes stop_codon:yes gene_type:complete
VSYQPKGGMCATCTRRDDDCSHLPFYQMPVISKFKDAAIVRCTQYQRETQEASQ